MKKPRRESPTKSQQPAQLPARDLQRVRGGGLTGDTTKTPFGVDGGITAQDDWEAPVV